MSLNIQTVYDEAIKLPPVQKAKLIETLLESFNHPTSNNSACWEKEINNRWSQFKNGEMKTKSASQVLSEINKPKT